MDWLVPSSDKKEHRRSIDHWIDRRYSSLCCSDMQCSTMSDFDSMHWLEDTQNDQYRTNRNPVTHSNNDSVRCENQAVERSPAFWLKPMAPVPAWWDCQFDFKGVNESRDEGTRDVRRSTWEWVSDSRFVPTVGFDTRPRRARRVVVKRTVGFLLTDGLMGVAVGDQGGFRARSRYDVALGNDQAIAETGRWWFEKRLRGLVLGPLEWQCFACVSSRHWSYLWIRKVTWPPQRWTNSNAWVWSNELIGRLSISRITSPRWRTPSAGLPAVI